MLRDTFAQHNGPRAYPRTREQVDALPYAQMGLKLNGKSPAILVLGEQINADLHWVSANRSLIVTRGGRIVRTVGLPVDLLEVRQLGPDFLQQYDFETQQLGSTEFKFSVDFGTQYSIPASSSFTIAADENIEILGERIDSLRIDEKVRCDDLRWTTTNRYWLSKRSALVWRSQQTVVPDGPLIECEILKRPHA